VPQKVFFCPMNSGEFTFDAEFGEVKDAWSIRSVPSWLGA